MDCIKALIILSVAAFHLPIMPWGKGTDDFVADSVHLQVFLEKSGLVSVSGKTVSKFSPIVCLNTLDRTWECLYQMIYKLSGKIGVVFLECFHETPTRILVNSRILEKLFSDDLGIFQTGRWDKFHINLDPLSGIEHLFIRLGDILWVRRVYRHDPLFSEETVESGNGAGITSLLEFYSENDQTSMGISVAHITDQLDFIVRVLVRMMVRSAGVVTQRLDRADPRFFIIQM